MVADCYVGLTSLGSLLVDDRGLSLSTVDLSIRFFFFVLKNCQFEIISRFVNLFDH